MASLRSVSRHFDIVNEVYPPGRARICAFKNCLPPRQNRVQHGKSHTLNLRLKPVRDLLQNISPAEILLHSNYEKTGPEKLGREGDLHPVRQTDPGKLAREADVPPARDNDLVPDQKERSDDALAI